MTAPIKYAENTANIFLGSSKVKVESVRDHPAYVCVPKKKLFFNFKRFFPNQNISVKEMMTFNGLLFHEILHVKHTVRAKRFKKSLTRDLKSLMGSLEDGRIETLGILRHPKMKDYFTFAVNEMLLSKKEEIGTDAEALARAYILCYGRSIYFPDKDLMAHLRKTMMKSQGQEFVETIERAVDEYIFEKSCVKRHQIAKKLNDYLNGKNVSVFDDKSIKEDLMTNQDEGQRKTKDQKQMEKALSDSKTEKESQDKEMQNQMEEELSEEDKKMIQGMNNLLNQISNVRKEKGKKTREKFDERDSEKRQILEDEIDELDDQEDDVEQEIKDWQRSNQLDEKAETDKKIEEKKSDNENLVEKHRKTLSNDIKTAKRLEGNQFADDTFSVNGAMNSLSKKLQRGLQELNTSLEASYVQRQTRGRLNVRRMLNRKDLTDRKIFNRFTPSRITKSKMLINIFIDGSGSMTHRVWDDEGNDIGTRWDVALNSCWVINDALNRDRNKVLVYQFSDDFRQMKEYDSKLRNDDPISNQTYLAPAIRDAVPQIKAYQIANGFTNVVNIAITDGNFHDTGYTNQEFKALEKLGHHNILIGVGCNINPERHPDIQHVVNLRDFTELSGLLIRTFKKMKSKFIKEVMN